MQITPLPDLQTEEEINAYVIQIDLALEYGPGFFGSDLFDIDTELEAIININLHVKNLVDATERLDLTEELGIPEQWLEPLDLVQVRARLESMREGI